MGRLTADLAGETAQLRELLVGLDGPGWELPTPSVGWAVRDQVSHLAHFDDAAVRAATDPDGFTAELTEALRTTPPGADITPDAVAERHRGMPPPALLDWFDTSRARLVSVFAALDPAARLPWYGPPMSAASSVTARLMETWAHGQDVADALGVTREPTARLRHVAHLGVRTRGFSYQLRGRTAPDTPVRVELTAPDGGLWTWGPADAADRVTGPAPDFCLLVTQRRHRDDLDLTVTGPAAEEWMSLAQAFAGLPGPGRAPARAGA